MLHSKKLARLALLLAIVLMVGVGNLVMTEAQGSGSAAVVLEQRSLTSMANGIFFDDEDNLYIASVLGRELIVMNPDTGEILDRIGTEQGVDSPDDVTISPDGSVYWTDLLSGTVGRLQPDGTLTKQFIAPGVNPIAFNDNGQLFVGLDFLGDALYEVDPELQDAPRLIAENLGNFNAFDFDPNGFLWGPLFSLNKIIMVVPGSGQIHELFMEDGFVVPVAAKFNSKGELHVLDMVTAEVAKVDTILGTKEVIGRARTGSDNLAFDSKDRLFVSNNTDGSIIEILSNGTNRVVHPGNMITPSGVAVLPSPSGGETVFVVSSSRKLIPEESRLVWWSRRHDAQEQIHRTPDHRSNQASRDREARSGYLSGVGHSTSHLLPLASQIRRDGSLRSETTQRTGSRKPQTQTDVRRSRIAQPCAQGGD